MNELLSSSQPAIVAGTLQACKKGGGGRGGVWGKVVVVVVMGGGLEARSAKNASLHSSRSCSSAVCRLPKISLLQWKLGATRYLILMLDIGPISAQEEQKQSLWLPSNNRHNSFTSQRTTKGC